MARDARPEQSSFVASLWADRIAKEFKKRMTMPGLGGSFTEPVLSQRAMLYGEDLEPLLRIADVYIVEREEIDRRLHMPIKLLKPMPEGHYVQHYIPSSPTMEQFRAALDYLVNVAAGLRPEVPIYPKERM